MTRNQTYNCPSCDTYHTINLMDASLLICKNCGAIVADRIMGTTRPTLTRIPDDWSFIQLGTTGEYDNQPFKIIGRCRLQLRNDYRNFWCAEYGHGKSLWIAESFASFTVFTSPWKDYTKDVSKLRAGSVFTISSDKEKLTGEYVEKCEGISYEGELGPWKLFTPGFYVVQASHGVHTAIFFIELKKNVDYMEGNKIDFEKLKLKNTLSWNEWK